jgi:BirA family biotin operon repressor/biotin-[acetyl-CoA-carboxylase] ligase
MEAELLENKEAQRNGHITAKQSNAFLDDDIDEVEEKKESKPPEVLSQIAREHFGEIDSTLVYARNTKDPFAKQWRMVTANRQRKGIERGDAPWVSPPNVNLYITYMTRVPPEKFSVCPHMTQIGAISVAQTLEEYGLSPSIKWPNDVMLYGRKISGLGGESSWNSMSAVTLLLNIGLNVNMGQQQCKTIDQPATSMFVATGRRFNRERVLETLTCNVLRNVQLCLAEGFGPTLMPFLKKRMAYLGQEITVANEERTTKGIFKGLDDYGWMKLSVDSQDQSIPCGKIVRKKEEPSIASVWEIASHIAATEIKPITDIKRTFQTQAEEEFYKLEEASKTPNLPFLARMSLMRQKMSVLESMGNVSMISETVGELALDGFLFAIGHIGESAKLLKPITMAVKVGAKIDNEKLLSKLVKQYAQDMECYSGIKMMETQRLRLKAELKAMKFEKLEGQALTEHRNLYKNKSLQEKLKADWTKNSRQAWPTHTENVYTKSGEILYEAGSPYEIHHIIHQSHRGPHEWWNVYPIPRQGHQGGIHRMGASGQLIHDKK